MSNRIESDALNEIYSKWVIKNYPANAKNHSLYWNNHIDRVNLTYAQGKAFDEFVWQSGGHIRQENGRRYVEFFDDLDATMFLLKWS